MSIDKSRLPVSQPLPPLSGPDVLSGDLLELYSGLERLFVRLAAGRFNAPDHLFPATIPLAEISKTHYLQSFPHLATFPTSLDPDPVNLREFAARSPLRASGELDPSRLSPIREILAPAACYHFYFRLQGHRLDSARCFTTNAVCFRREASFSPLERRPSFMMREIVCIGGLEEVRAFLARCRESASELCGRLDLPIEWKPASDPFFDASSNPRWVFGKLQQVKLEMVFEDRLAIGSLNNHLNYFGETFSIGCGGEPAFSACLAFGVERWVAAFLSRHGRDKAHWPALDFDPCPA